jgi:hypothetical protein
MSESGIDYTIETNGRLYKSECNLWPTLYSHNADVEVVSTTSVREFRIAKSAFDNLASTITIGYVDLTKCWTQTSQLPTSGKMPSYSLN